MLESVLKGDFEEDFANRTIEQLVTSIQGGDARLEVFVDLLAFICCRLSAQSKQGTIHEIEDLVQIHSTQLLAIMLILGFDQADDRVGQNQLIEILTGEGKSMVLAIVAAFYALIGEKVEVRLIITTLCYPRFLLKDMCLDCLL
jgi:hypothetical protein